MLSIGTQFENRHIGDATATGILIWLQSHDVGTPNISKCILFQPNARSCFIFRALHDNETEIGA